VRWGQSILNGSIHKKWILIFSLWIVFLSGLPANLIGSPGVLQANRLEYLLTAKVHQLDQAEQEVRKLKTEASLLETNRFWQLREIRRTLGYAAPDEIIFDVSQLQ